MTTVDDKLKLFAKIIFEKIEKDSEYKTSELEKTYNEFLENERQNLLKQSEIMVNQTRKKAESKRDQIISKANIDKQHILLRKRKELFDRTVNDVRRLGLEFTKQPEYMDFLKKLIHNGLLGLDFDEVLIYFKPDDHKAYGDRMNEFIEQVKKPQMKVSILETEKDILGGCILENMDQTMRIDCSISSLIEDNKKLIGKILIDNL